MRAFTLLESLIYLALFGIIMSGMLGGIWAFTESANRIQTQALLETEGNFLLQKIQYEVRHAKTISEPSGAGTTSELVLTTNNAENTSDSGPYIEFYLADTVLMRTANETSLPLSSNSVTLSNLSFRKSNTDAIVNTTDPESLTTSFQLSATSSSGQNISQDFSTTDYLFP